MEGCFGGNDLSKYAEQNLASYTIHLYLIKTGEKKHTLSTILWIYHTPLFHAIQPPACSRDSIISFVIHWGQRCKAKDQEWPCCFLPKSNQAKACTTGLGLFSDKVCQIYCCSFSPSLEAKHSAVECYLSFGFSWGKFSVPALIISVYNLLLVSSLLLCVSFKSRLTAHGILEWRQRI